MIQIERLPDRNILVITPSGPLTEDDFGKLAQALDPLTESTAEAAGLMIHARSFPGWNGIGAFLAHMKFVGNNHRRIDRVALVTDSDFAKLMASVASHFVAPEIKRFDFNDKDRALSWLETAHQMVRKQTSPA
jgi:hypothetical protein